MCFPQMSSFTPFPSWVMFGLGPFFKQIWGEWGERKQAKSDKAGNSLIQARGGF